MLFKVTHRHLCLYGSPQSRIPYCLSAVQGAQLSIQRRASVLWYIERTMLETNGNCFLDVVSLELMVHGHRFGGINDVYGTAEALTRVRCHWWEICGVEDHRDWHVTDGWILLDTRGFNF